MRFKKCLVAAVSLSAFACGLAHAQTNKWFVGAEYGLSSIKDNSQQVQSNLIGTFGGTASVSQDTSVSAPRVFFGYNFNNFIAAELGYLQTDNVKTKISGVGAVGPTPYSGTGTISVSGADLSAIIRPLPNNLQSGLFLRVGVSSYTTKTDVSISAGGVNSSASGSTSGSGTNLGIGYDMPVGSGNVRFAYTNMANISNNSNSSIDAFSVGYLWKF